MRRPIEPGPIDTKAAIPFVSTRSMTFFGADDRVTLGNPADLQLTGAMTIAAWIRTLATGTKRIVSKRGATGQRGYNLELQAGTDAPHFNISSDGTVVFDSNTAHKITGEWNLLHGIYKPSTHVQIYVNGAIENENVTSIPATQHNSTADVNIGSGGDASSFFDGHIDEVMIYDIDFTAAQVIEHANGLKPVDPFTLSTIGNLVGWWRMGDGLDTISTIFDLSENSNNGTPTNMEARFITGNVPS